MNRREKIKKLKDIQAGRARVDDLSPLACIHINPRNGQMTYRGKKITEQEYENLKNRGVGYIIDLYRK